MEKMMVETLDKFEECPCGSLNVGDDEGRREYPFVTSSKVLAIMRRLHEIQQKQLYHDIAHAAQDYDHCPKGSQMPKECKPSLPGAYYSCPILHEAGDDFCNLPLSSAGRSVKSNPSMSLSRRAKKRQNCRKCSATPFNLFDASIYHENYLKFVTYAKLKPGKSISRCYSAPRDRDSNSDKKACGPSPNSEDDVPLEIQSQSALDNLRDLMDPRNRPLSATLAADDKKPRKRRGKAAAKPVVLSRYRDSINRRGRNLRSTNAANSQTTLLEENVAVAETPKNPFPMPDVFEGIYFGNMPESFNTLPVTLQNFKRSQMKMAEESPKMVLDAQMNEPSNNISLKLKSPRQSGLRISEEPSSVIPEGFSFSEKIIHRDLPTVTNRARARNHAMSQSLRNIHNQKAKKLNSKENSSSVVYLPGRKNKSCNNLPRVGTAGSSKGSKGKKKKLKHTKVKQSVDRMRENPYNHDEIDSNFRGKDGKFSTEKFRESLINFIENFQSVKGPGPAVVLAENIATKEEPRLEEPPTIHKRGLKSNGTPRRTKSTYPQQASASPGPVTITIYKNAAKPEVASMGDAVCGKKISVSPQDFPSKESSGDNKSGDVSNPKRRKPKAISLNRNPTSNKKRQK